MWFKSTVATVRLRRGGELGDLELAETLAMGEDSRVRMGIMEIAARLEDVMMDEAAGGNDQERLRNLARIEGVREFTVQFLDWTTRLREAKEREETRKRS